MGGSIYGVGVSMGTLSPKKIVMSYFEGVRLVYMDTPKIGPKSYGHPLDTPSPHTNIFFKYTNYIYKVEI